MNSMKSWSDIGFEIEITGDRSPSLRLLQSVDLPNIGANPGIDWRSLRETLWSMESSICDVLTKVENPHFLVVGLGPSYIELKIYCARSFIAKKFVGLITGFEAFRIARILFQMALWSQSRTAFGSVGCLWVRDKNVILGTALSAAELKSFLKLHFRSLQDISDGFDLKRSNWPQKVSWHSLWRF